MAFVKGFDINGINTIQTACIELQARPNAATEGAVGLLAMDMSSSSHDVYKCVAVKGSVYTWELLSSGFSLLTSSETKGGIATVRFTYADLKMPGSYVVKAGDLILDSKGYLYRIVTLLKDTCLAEYTNICLNRDGVGISHIEQTLSNEDGGENILKIMLTDGNKFSYTVKNGSKGSPGKSSFEIAKENGMTDAETEQEWINSLIYPEFFNCENGVTTPIRNVTFLINGDTLTISTVE